MSVDSQTVQKVAHLARLSLSEEAVAPLAEEMSNILKLVEKMSEVDTSGVLPLAHPLELKQPLRDDQVTETNQRDEFLKLAPLSNAGLYLVPKVI